MTAGTLQLPRPREAFDLVAEDGAVTRVRVHGNTGGARVLLSHGNGFAIDGYYAFWKLLLERFEVVLFDFRNHGRNPPSDPAHHTYEWFVRDLRMVYDGASERLGERTTVGAFHSMAARTAMKQAVEGDFPGDALVLFDPANVPLPGHPLFDGMTTFEHKLAAWARKRRERFASPDEFAAEYAASRAHSRWVAGTHALMALAVLRQDADRGDWVLACPPALEEKTYLGALEMELWPRYEEYGGPVKLIASDPDAPGAPLCALANRVMASESDYVYEAIAGTGHMLQIEKPADCARAMLSYLETLGIGV